MAENACLHLATRLARMRSAGAMRHETRNVALKQETFAIGAVNWRMIDASGTPDQPLHSARVSLLAVPGER